MDFWGFGGRLSRPPNPHSLTQLRKSLDSDNTLQTRSNEQFKHDVELQGLD